MKNFTTFSFLILIVVLTSCSSRKYVSYLKDHTEVVEMTDTLQFNSLDKTFYKNKLFLVGEVHEVASSPRIDYAMFAQLNEKVNIDIYLAEMDIAQGYYLQKYLEGSDDRQLKDILKKWVVYIGSISEQYRNKWVKMRAYYAQLPEAYKFKLVAIDKISDFNLLRELLKEKLPTAYHSAIPVSEEALIAWSEAELKTILETEVLELATEDARLLKNIQFNLANHKNIRSRDQFMYLNFKRYYTQNEWKDENIYGGFGFAHTLQAYDYMLAGRIKNDTSMPYFDKMVSMNALYVDSRLTVDSRALPKFMQDKGEDFTRFKYSQDNRLFMYIQGIADYKRVTEPNSISLLKLDAKDSPYLNSTRGTKVKKLITIWEGYDILEGTVTTDYAQYVFFVRNADWITPDERI
ncbi:hypothetical protein KO504_07720 [Winogradskyella psychrotolerans]|uniref:hypothetical protein n=1 Tax=Winogradskyella psychrotolerans TaxID=1344585 RepID=UPI001C0779E4|nr:hypothetical protein [Winogradskyella psychrotolerans]MBU2921228.1 hypothetical protein [Winogradskyella psychrotolerans]